MTRQQVGWYDGNRVHQMHARPVGEVPRHLAHTADWVPVFAGDDAPKVPTGWDEAITKLCTDWDIDRDIATSIFQELLPHWARDPNQTHIWLSLDQLTRRDDYGVYGSDFYSCRLCDAESCAGVLNKGIPHAPGCPLHDDNYGKLITAPAAPLPPSLQAEAQAVGAGGYADSLEPSEPVL